MTDYKEIARERSRDVSTILGLIPAVTTDAIATYYEHKRYYAKTWRRLRSWYSREYCARRFVRGRKASEILWDEYIDNRDKFVTGNPKWRHPESESTVRFISIEKIRNKNGTGNTRK